MPEQKEKSQPKAKPTVIQALEVAKKHIFARLPSGTSKEQFFLGIVTAIQRSKANAQPGKSLADCDPGKVLLAAYEAAELGCSLNPSLQLGWLIPYAGEVNFQPSYRFFIQRAYDTGEVNAFFAEVVYKGDVFKRQLAPKRTLIHEPGDEPRTKENALGAYALIEFKDGAIDYEYLTAEQIEKHHKHSKAPNSLMWTDFWGEAWRKTPVRVLAKRLPMKGREFEKLVELINRDSEKDIELSPDDFTVVEPKRLSETAQEQPAQEAQPAASQAASAESSEKKTAEEAKPQAEKKNGGSQSGMFSEEADPFLTPAEQNDFWKKAFEANLTKKGLQEFLEREYKISSPKEIRRSQLNGIVDAIQKGARE